MFIYIDIFIAIEETSLIGTPRDRRNLLAFSEIRLNCKSFEWYKNCVFTQTIGVTQLNRNVISLAHTAAPPPPPDHEVTPKIVM